MSVAGFDIGNLKSVVALARRNGIDVLLNSESKRETPSYVNFGSKQRFIGVAAGEKISMEPKNTVTDLKRLIGKKYTDAELQQDLKTLTYEVVQGPDNVPLVRVDYLGQRASLTPEQLCAALLSELKTIAEKDQGAKVTDCVISVPMFYTEAQRRAVLDSAHIVGLNVLRLIHETTATALAYGIYKTDLPADKPIHVAFVDCGHASLQVSIVAFTKAGLKVVGQGFDSNFGGRNFDEVIYDNLATEFKEKYKIDVRTNIRASLRMRIQAEKAKKILSANPEAQFAIESLMNDVDVRANLHRDQFEEWAKSILDRVLNPMKAALADSGLNIEDISSVEIVGGCSRAPALVKAVEAFFGKPVSRTLNATEAVARGCALQGAMLSPTFHVTKRFEVEDRFCHAVTFSWRASEEGPEAERTSSLVFPHGNAIPSSKMLTFFRTNMFPLEAEYAPETPLPEGEPRGIAKFDIGPLPPPKAGGKSKLKVKVRLNLHGIVSVESASVVEEEEAGEGNGDAKMADADAGAAEAAGAGADGGADGAKPMETDAAKKKVKKTDVPVKSATLSLAPARLQELTEKEFEMALQDRMMEETKEKKNAVEAYVLDMRSKLESSHAAFVSQAARESLMQKLQQTEDWLYEDGEDETKGVYVAKLEELQALGGPIEERYKESTARGPAAQALRKAAESFAAQAADPARAHIDAAQLESVRKECEHALSWLSEKEAAQARLAQVDPPAFLSRECSKKLETLNRFCVPILATPKPKAPAPQPEAPKAEPMETDAPGEQPAPGPKAEDLD